MKSQFKTADGEQINFENSADVVKYGAGTLEDAMKNLAAFDVSYYGRKILKAENAAELRHLLKVRESFSYDPAQILRWDKVGLPAINSYGLSVSASNKLTSTGFELGGNPFTIEFRAQFPTNTQSGIIGFSCGNISVQFGPANNLYLLVNGAQVIRAAGGTYNSGSSHQNFEFGYNGSMVHGFIDGYRVNTSSNPGTVTIPRAARTITLGGASGYFKWLRISDGICRHAAVFTPQTPTLDAYTVSLLNFS